MWPLRRRFQTTGKAEWLLHIESLRASSGNWFQRQSPFHVDPTNVIKLFRFMILLADSKHLYLHCVYLYVNARNVSPRTRSSFFCRKTYFQVMGSSLGNRISCYPLIKFAFPFVPVWTDVFLWIMKQRNIIFVSVIPRCSLCLLE